MTQVNHTETLNFFTTLIANTNYTAEAKTDLIKNTLCAFQSGPEFFVAIKDTDTNPDPSHPYCVHVYNVDEGDFGGSAEEYALSTKEAIALCATLAK